MMSIKKVEEIREEYRERALERNNPNKKIRDIWNTSVYISSSYRLLKNNPIKNVKYAIKMIRKMRQLEILMEGENF